MLFHAALPGWRSAHAGVASPHAWLAAGSHWLETFANGQTTSSPLSPPPALPLAQISKLVTKGVDRPSTLAAMRRALDSYVIRGVQHNAPLLRSVLDIPAFRAGQLSTAFLAGKCIGAGGGEQQRKEGC